MLHLVLRHLPVLLLVLSTGPVGAVDVPFSTGHTIDGNVDSVLAVDVADIDGDGDLDVLGGWGELAWWENLDGLGTSWTEHTIDSDANGASWVHAADVDGDGDLDVLWTTVDGTIRLWRNADGVGTSWTPRLINPATSHLANSADAANMDGDGDLDVLISAVVLGATEDDNIEWWENVNGFAATNRHTIDGDLDGACGVGGACPVKGVDVDGDGDIDVVGAKSDASEIVWWENVNGAGTSWTEHSIDSDFEGAALVHAADLDGDGDTDVIGAVAVGGDIAWWENLSGAGTSWTAHTIDGDFDGAYSVHAADVDGDGDLDVLGASRTDDELTWWENHIGTGANWTAHTIDAAFDGALSVKAADIDGDGDLDVLGAADIANDITWWVNKTIHRSAVFPIKHPISGFFGDAWFVHGADIDGDGDLDVVETQEFSGAVIWWENLDGSATSWSAHGVAFVFNGVLSVDTADVDADGNLDIVVSAYGDGYVAWYENADGVGTIWTAHTIDDTIEAARAVDAADMDGDGDVDVIGTEFTADAILWWENVDGAGTSWSAHTIKSDFNGPRSVQAADMDGDGDLDVLASATFADDVGWWENLNGLGTSWTEHLLDDDFNGAFSAYAADMDNDGDLDVLAASDNYDGVTWWENLNGAGTSWAAHSIDIGFDLFQSIHAEDLDQDGDLDVLATAFYEDDIKWWENADGSGTAWFLHSIVGDFDGVRTAFAADIDSDGDLDVLAAARFADEIAWWENRGGQFALPTTALGASELTVPE